MGIPYDSVTFEFYHLTLTTMLLGFCHGRLGVLPSSGPTLFNASSFASYSLPVYGRLHSGLGTGAWCAEKQDTNQYLQVWRTVTYFIYTEIFASSFAVWKRVSDFISTNQRGETSFSHVKKIVSSNHKPRLKRIVFSRSSRVPLSGSFDKIIFSVYASCS